MPPLEWLERRRVPSPLAALVCVALFLVVANIAIASIVVPATDWLTLLPDRIGRVRTTLRPLIDVYASIQKFVDQAMHLVQQQGRSWVRTVAIETPNSLVDLIATSAPAAIVQMFFGVLVVYFFLAGWSRMRRRTIVGRGSFGGAMTMARVIQEVVDATSAYLGTITLINASVGLLLSLALSDDRHADAADVGRAGRAVQLRALSRADRRASSCSRSAACWCSSTCGTRCCRR